MPMFCFFFFFKSGSLRKYNLWERSRPQLCCPLLRSWPLCCQVLAGRIDGRTSSIVLTPRSKSLALSLTCLTPAASPTISRRFSPFRWHLKFKTFHRSQLCVSVRSERGITIRFTPNKCQTCCSNYLIKPSLFFLESETNSIS